MLPRYRYTLWAVATTTGNLYAWLLLIGTLDRPVGLMQGYLLAAGFVALAQSVLLDGLTLQLRWFAASAAGSVLYWISASFGYIGGPWIALSLAALCGGFQVGLLRLAWGTSSFPLQRLARNVIAGHVLAVVMMWVHVLVARALFDLGGQLLPAETYSLAVVDSLAMGLSTAAIVCPSAAARS